MKILVTGGGGYVGNILCRDLLSKGHEVRCVDNFHKGQCDALMSLMVNPPFEFMYGDVTNVKHVENMLDGIDGVIHLAAIVGFPACLKQPALATSVNIDGTQNLLEQRDPNIPFVFASTGSVYGKVDGICTEDSPLNAVSLYGETKKAAEREVSNRHNTVSFRFATGFGVSPCMRVNLLVNDFVLNAYSQKCLNVFQADFRRTFVHVRDMSRAFIFGLENVGILNHKVYNVGDNDLNWTKRELAEYIGEKTGASINYAETGEDLDKRDYSVDYSRLNDEGFKCKVSMEQGIDELVKTVPLLQIRHQYQ